MIAMLGVMLGCTKKKIVIPIPTLPKEENIVFSIEPDPGTGVAVAIGGTYGFKVNITSKLPGSGVKLDLTTKKDADNSMIDSKSLDSNSPGIDLSTGTLSPGILCTVTVVVTSKTTATNTVTKSFKVARK